MTTPYWQRVAATSGTAIVLAAVVSCGSGKPMQKIEEDITIPQMTIGETVTGEPEAPAGDTETQTTPPPTPEIPHGPLVTGTPPPEFGHPH